MIIFSNKCGQLGNRLFAFAHLIAYSEAHKLKLINLSFDEYAKYFQQTRSDLFCRYPPAKSLVQSDRLRSWLFVLNKAILKGLRLIRFSKSPLHRIVLADLPEYQFNDLRYYDLRCMAFARETPMLFLFGRFFRDYENLKMHQHKVKEYFTPISEIQNHVEHIYEQIKLNAGITIGVHIRRGDYSEFANGKYLYSLNQYYEKMFELKQSLNDKRLTFIVCSNEDVDLSYFKTLPVVKGPGHLVKDMYLLAKCDYIMGPPSTYALWASFYGNKPLYQIKEIDKRISPNDFEILEPSVLYNFSFN